MTKEQLFEQIKKKNSYLCIGLDTDIEKIPKHLFDFDDPIFEFNKQIIDSTSDYCVAYKPNIAFYEALGAKGWESLVKTVQYIPDDCFTIADAKRGDIGNTSSLYARAFFDKPSSGMAFDSVTVAPYMGQDSVRPFLEFNEKWVILLALTSNAGSQDFQMQKLESGEYLYQEVIRKSLEWGSENNMMYVVGATQTDYLAAIRKLIPNHFLLIPGVGAQGGDLGEVSRIGMNAQCGLLVNSSRNIIYASNNTDFAMKSRMVAKGIRDEMKGYLETYL